jgi:iron(III) transport system ATP-binding protein
MIALEVKNLSKSYSRNELPAVYDVSFSLQKGEILALVGPSGCGKTTTLRLIAGFEQPDAGQVYLAERLIADKSTFVPPEKRDVGMVFQDHALFPHLKVIENVYFGLMKKTQKEKEASARSMLNLLGMDNLSNRYPHELSGGERQRVALARALAPQPVVLLLDEPFSSLDADLRHQIREDVRVILKGISASAIFVTHDQEEALYMGDRLAVVNQGRLEQIAHPEAIFSAPANRFVAEFMGQTDFITGLVAKGGIQTEIGILTQKLDLPLGTEVEIAVRADDITFDLNKNGSGMILGRQFKGALNIYRLRLPSGRIVHAFQPHTRILKPGTRVIVRADPGHDLACYYDERYIGNPDYKMRPPS